MFQPSYGLITDLGELRERVGQIISDGRAFSWDIETGYTGESREKGSLHPEENFLAGLSFTNSLKWSRYAAIAHDTGPNLDERAAAEILYPLLVEARDAQGQPLGVCHGAKFELRVTRRWFERVLGITLDYRQFRVRSCTMLESYAEAVNRSHGLKELTELQAEVDRSGFWHKQLELEELFPEKLTAKQKKCIRFNVLDPLDPRVQQYACEDTIYTLAHHRMRYPRLIQALEADPGRGPGFIWRLEMSVLPVVCEMEDEGLWYDWAAMYEWASTAKLFAARYMDEIRQDFGELRGAPLEPAFNFGSSQQLARLLYEDCGMPVRHWTSGGKSGIKKPGTDAKVALKGLSGQYPEVAKYLNWKRLTKLYRDFLEAFEDKYCFAEDGRAHPSLLQHGVPAGRFAHADPNYAQSPKKYHYELRDGTSFDFNFRTMIGAPPGWYQLGFDLAQAELRAVAGMAQEERLIEAFSLGIDVHKVTGSLVFGTPVDGVTEDQRDVGKTLGFALVYGLTEDGLADRLGITRQQAQDLFAAFHAAYPRISKWMAATVNQARETGYVETWWGRRVRVWDIDSYDRRRRKEAERTAGNAPVQGSATGDYMKLAMVRADAALHKAGLKDRVRLVMNVHDALEWYVRRDVPPAQVIRVLQPAVIFPVPGWPPMVADWHCGERWGSVRKLDVITGADGAVGSVALARKDGVPVETEDSGLEDEDEDDVAPAAPRALPAIPLVQAAPPQEASAGPGAELAFVPEAEGPPRTVIITVPSAPAREDIEQLVTHCRLRPGPNTVVLRLPGGEARLDFTTALSPADAPMVSVVLGSAVVTYDEASVDLAAMAKGVIGA
jgi:DNA polymerase I